MAMKRTRHDEWWFSVNKELLKRAERDATLGEIVATLNQTTDPAWAAQMIVNRRHDVAASRMASESIVRRGLAVLREKLR